MMWPKIINRLRSAVEASLAWRCRSLWTQLLWQFCKTLAVVIAIICALTLIPEEAATWYVVYLLPVILVGAIALPFYLWRSERSRTLVFSILAIAIVALAQFALMTRDAGRIAAFDQRQFLPPQEKHDFVVSYWGNSKCLELCMEILAKTSYRPVSEVRSADQWIVFSLGKGQACAQTDTRNSYLAFLTAGFADKCAVRSTQTIGTTALVVRSYHDRDRVGSSKSMSEGIPGSFEGNVYELYERTNGKERLLGRWVNGHVRPLSYWFGLVGLRGWRVGDEFGGHDFYAAALQAALVGGRFPGNSDLDRVFDQLETLLADPRSENGALNALRFLAEWKGKGVQDSIENRAVRLLNKPEPVRILAGFRLLGAFWKVDISRVQPRIIELLEHGDPRVVAAALTAAFKLPDQARHELKGELAALANSPVLASADSPVLQPLLGHFRDLGAFPEPDRMRAKMLLVENGSLSRAQRAALLAVLAHGDRSMRDEAGKTLGALTDRALFDVVLAVSDVGWPTISGQRRDTWTDHEMALLVARADRVQPDQLLQYVNALRSQERFEDHASDIAGIVRARLDEARMASPLDTEHVRTLERLLKSL